MEIKTFDYGIYLGLSNRSTISGTNITNNNRGIWFVTLSNNSISGNNITNNDIGIALIEASNYKIIRHNNFVDNTEQAHIYRSITFGMMDILLVETTGATTLVLTQTVTE